NLSFLPELSLLKRQLFSKMRGRQPGPNRGILKFPLEKGKEGMENHEKSVKKVEREQSGAPNPGRSDHWCRAGAGGSPGRSHRTAGRFVCGRPEGGGPVAGAVFGDDRPLPPPGGAEGQHVP